MADGDQSTLLCSFGLITDIQYADLPNGTNYHKTKTRYYRNALEQLKTAVSEWSDYKHNVAFVLQLGDLIDGVNNQTPGASDTALRECLAVFNQMKDTPVHHVIGNHELYNFSRDTIVSGPLNTSKLPGVEKDCCNTSEKCMFYQFVATRGLRVVVLDTYEISMLGQDKTSPEYKKAYNILRQYNKNDDVNDNRGLDADHSMFAAYNAAVSSHQLDWLERTLRDAENNKENVILVGHQGLHPHSGDISTVCWNYNDILEILHRHSSCVVGYLSGHDHDSGSCYEDLIHYITFRGVIEVSPDTQAFATAHVYGDRIELVGSGCVPDFTLQLKNRIVTENGVKTKMAIEIE